MKTIFAALFFAVLCGASANARDVQDFGTGCFDRSIALTINELGDRASRVQRELRERQDAKGVVYKFLRDAAEQASAANESIGATLGRYFWGFLLAFAGVVVVFRSQLYLQKGFYATPFLACVVGSALLFYGGARMLMGDFTAEAGARAKQNVRRYASTEPLQKAQPVSVTEWVDRRNALIEEVWSKLGGYERVRASAAESKFTEELEYIQESRDDLYEVCEKLGRAIPKTRAPRKPKSTEWKFPKVQRDIDV